MFRERVLTIWEDACSTNFGNVQDQDQQLGLFSDADNDDIKSNFTYTVLVCSLLYNIQLYIKHHLTLHSINPSSVITQPSIDLLHAPDNTGNAKN